MLNLERLQALAVLREHGSIRAAAQILHVTPSALSQQIAKLQHEIGAPLTMPRGRGVQLTPKGLLLADRATAILDLAAQAEAELASMDNDVAGIVRVGTFPSASRVIVPRALTELRSAYTRLEIRFTTDDTEQLLDGVYSGTLDLAMVDSWDGSPITIPARINSQILYRDVVDVALPNDHPLAGSRPVSLEQLADIPWVIWRPGQTFSNWLVQAMRRLGIEPNLQYDVPDFASQLAFVAAGLGAAVVPRLASAWVSDSVSMVELAPALGREILAITRRDTDRPALRAVVKAMQHSFDLQARLGS